MMEWNRRFCSRQCMFGRPNVLQLPKCEREGCGKPCKGRRFCSRECAIACSAKAQRRCVECGESMPDRASGNTTCSDACSAARRAKVVAASRETVSKPCEICGVEMIGRPSEIANKRTCGPACLSELRARSRKPPAPCVVCGVLCLGRKTCGEACFAESVRRRASVGVRSELQRVKRRAAERAKYRGKDKADVCARLTAEQGGKCACCGLERPLVLDHDHATGRPRAMLCRQCNAAFGLMGECPDRVAALARYAGRWK